MQSASLKKQCKVVSPVPAGRWAGLWPVFWAGRNQASQEHLSSLCVPCGEILPLYPKLGIPGKHFSLTSLSLRSVEAACASITRSLQLLSQFRSCHWSWLSFSSSNCLLFSQSINISSESQVSYNNNINVLIVINLIRMYTKNTYHTSSTFFRKWFRYLTVRFISAKRFFWTAKPIQWIFWVFRGFGCQYDIKCSET